MLIGKLKNYLKIDIMAYLVDGKNKKVLILSSIFVMMIPVAVLISAKITSVFGLTLTVGAFAYVITFPITDIIGDVKGKEAARQLVNLGLISYLLTVVFVQFAIYMPPADFWSENQEAYKMTLGLTPRIALGSIMAYYLSQLHDVWAFHFWKKITHNKFLWLRNNLSTLVSQLLDSIVFILIAFYGTVSNSVLISMVVGQYIVKLCIAIIDTPVVYLGVWWLKKENKV